MVYIEGYIYNYCSTKQEGYNPLLLNLPGEVLKVLALDNAGVHEQRGGRGSPADRVGAEKEDCGGGGPLRDRAHHHRGHYQYCGAVLHAAGGSDERGCGGVLGDFFSAILVGVAVANVYRRSAHLPDADGNESGTINYNISNVCN